MNCKLCGRTLAIEDTDGYCLHCRITHPDKVPPPHRIHGRLKAIRQHCRDCVGSSHDIKHCTCTPDDAPPNYRCSLYPWRSGKRRKTGHNTLGPIIRKYCLDCMGGDTPIAHSIHTGSGVKNVSRATISGARIDASTFYGILTP